MEDLVSLKLPISLSRLQRQPSQTDSSWDHAYSSIHRQIYEGAAERDDRWDESGWAGWSESDLGTWCWVAGMDLCMRMKI